MGVSLEVDPPSRVLDETTVLASTWIVRHPETESPTKIFLDF
jgi:hypothetical protein